MIREQQLHEICIRRTPALTAGMLPDTFQWKQILKFSCRNTPAANDVLKIPIPHGAVFTGPAGNGRHTSAEALAGSLYSKGKDYSQVVFLYGEDLDFEDPADVAAVLKHIAVLTKEGDMVLVLDRPELSRHNLVIQRRLLRCQDILSSQNIRLFIILITGDSDDLDPEVMSRFPRYHCPCPDGDIVSNWVSSILKDPVPIKLSGINGDTLAERLTGLPWKCLLDFYNHLKRLMVHKYVDFARKQNPTTPEADIYTKGKIVFSAEDIYPILNSLSALRSKPEVSPAMIAPMAITQFAPAANSEIQKEAGTAASKTESTDSQDASITEKLKQAQQDAEVFFDI